MAVSLPQHGNNTYCLKCPCESLLLRFEYREDSVNTEPLLGLRAGWKSRFADGLITARSPSMCSASALVSSALMLGWPPMIYFSMHSQTNAVHKTDAHISGVDNGANKKILISSGSVCKGPTTELIMRPGTAPCYRCNGDDGRLILRGNRWLRACSRFLNTFEWEGTF